MAARNQPQTAVAERQQFEPLAPIGSAMTLKSMLQRQHAALASVLPGHITPERMIKTMLVAANKNPALLRCTQASIIQTVSQAAELGLDLSGTLGEAYPVPFNNKVKDKDQTTGRVREVWLEQCQLIIGYRGLAKLARQSGMIERLEAEPVYENDHFIYRKGSDFRVEFTPALEGDRGRLRGFYCYVKFNESAGGGEQADYMTRPDVEKVRQNAKSKNSPAWNNWYDEMGRKTVFRRTAKWLPLSAEKFQAAIEHDSTDYELDAGDVMPALTAGTEDGSKTASLAGQLAGDGNGEGKPDYVGRPMLTAEQVASITEMCGRDPVVDVAELCEVWAGDLDKIEGDEGEADESFHERVVGSLREIKTTRMEAAKKSGGK